MKIQSHRGYPESPGLFRKQLRQLSFKEPTRFKGRPQKRKPHARFHQHSPQPRASGAQNYNAGKYESASWQKKSGDSPQDKNPAKSKYGDTLECARRFGQAMGVPLQ